MFYLGIDFGTSGARSIVIDTDGNIINQTSRNFAGCDNTNLAPIWHDTLWELILQIPEQLRSQIQAIAINGTSATVMLCDAVGNIIDTPLLYNDARATSILPRLQALAPPQHPVISATSSLAKLLWMQQQPSFHQGVYFLHQADWLAFLLHGKLGISDYHNALKLGYDVAALKYPEWLENLEIPVKLPQILSPGTPIAAIKSEIARRYNFPTTCQICAGTTDSIAAFFASGAKTPGEAVTSLGSTLVIKLLSHTPIDNSAFGIYSHRFPNFTNSPHPTSTQPIWLVGGASNTGGSILRHFFTDEQLIQLSSQIDPHSPCELDYYPLLKPGERFPINDANLAPRLSPRPSDDREFLHGLLSSMARIEAQGYKLLQQLGATPLVRVYTAGGGAKNPVWTEIRSQYLQVPVTNSRHREAAYGSALLAMWGSWGRW